MFDRDTAQLRKARGAFFTPPALCRYLADWAIRSPRDAVLEPSCGEAGFLLAAADRLRTLGSGSTLGTLDGVDVHPASVETARRIVAGTGHANRITVADFFTLAPRAQYDAVLGNPPFVRYQDFTGEARELSRVAALNAGVSLTGLASSWAAFTVHSALFLKPGGRLGLVLPAELLSVNYAAAVREFLVRRFGRVRLVLFTERIFPGVLEEVVLLLADGLLADGGLAQGRARCELHQVHGIEELVQSGEPEAAELTSWQPQTHDKWTTALLPGPARDVLNRLTDHGGASTLQDWGATTLGAVTGNNGYFTRTPEQVRLAGLDPEQDLIRISPPGSAHLRGLTFEDPAWTALGEHGKATWLFRPSGEPSAAGRSYLACGERAGVPAAYKCRVRSPWWRVPLLPPADLLLTYMNADTPRLSANRAGVRHLNSVHGVRLRPQLRRTGMELLPLAALNSLTLLGAETVGRAYGGGMLKLEPREADRLPVPAPDLVASLRPELLAIRPAVLAALAVGQLLAAVSVVDEIVLAQGLGLPPAERTALRLARELLAGRRAARGNAPRSHH